MGTGRKDLEHEQVSRTVCGIFPECMNFSRATFKVYIFYVTLLELQKMLRKAESDSEPEAKVLREASEHNMELMKLFLRLLVRSDGGRKAGLAGSAEAKEFRRHFGYLRQIFPFL